LANYTGDCDPGYYCIGGASSSAPVDGTTGNICPKGSYCPQGSSTHYFCPNTTFTDYKGAAACQDCLAGYYCNFRDKAKICLQGYYCPFKIGLQQCPAGTYNPLNRLQNITQCTQCDGGEYCPYPAMNETLGQCSAGYYCKMGVNMAEPNGTNTGDGDICPLGHYCPVGTVSPLPCLAGTYR
jgi:hypothetical protein